MIVISGRGEERIDNLAKFVRGETTKRRREVSDLIDETVVGKFVLVGLKGWRQATA